jgi:hypothetical protein
MNDEDGLRFAEAVAARVDDGRLTRAAAEAQLHADLSAHCPSCRRTYQEALTLLFGPRPGRPRVKQRWVPAPPPPPGLAPSGRPSRAKRPEEPERVRRAYEALAKLKESGSWFRRRGLVATQWFHYRSTELGRLLLAEARDCLPGDPQESDRWAELAVLALHSSRDVSYPDPEERAVQSLRARLFRANAARCRGELHDAEQELDLAFHAAAALELRDLTFWAEAKGFLASMRRDQRDFPTATREARASAALYHAAGLPRAEALALWKLATIREGAGDFETALVVIREALAATTVLPSSRLWLDLRHFEGLTLARLGRFAEADVIRVSLRPLYDQHPDKAMLQHWLRALVKAGLGDHEAAAASFQFTRDGFVIRKNPYDAALVTLDWTLYLLDQNRPAEVVPLAVSMGQTFEALVVARETMASWALFREAAERLELERTEAAAWVEVLDFERVAGRGA